MERKRDKSGRFIKSKMFNDNAPGFWRPLSGGGSNGYYDAYQSQPAPGATDLLRAYEDCDVINACVNLISHNIAGYAHRVRLHVSTGSGEPRPQSLTRTIPLSTRKALDRDFHRHTRKALDVQEVVEHPLLELLDKPNPLQSMGKLLGMTSVYLELVGSSFWYLARNPLGKVNEIWLLPSQQMSIAVDDNGHLTGYKQHGTNEVFYEPDDIIHFRYNNPLDPYTSFGVSPVRACWQRIQLLRKEMASWDAVLANMAYPSMIISPGDAEQPIPKDTAERYQKELLNMFRYGNQGGPLVITDFVSVTPLAPPPKDLTAITMFEQVRKVVCNVFSIPAPMLDLDEQNGASANTARRMFQENSLKPRIVNILETITHRLCPPRLFLAVDQIVEPDLLFELQRTSALWQASLITQNEARGTQGLDPVNGGEKFLFQLLGNNNSGMGTLPSFQRTAPKARTKGYTQSPPDSSALAQALVDIYRQLERAVTPTLKNTKPKTKAFIEVNDWSQQVADQLAPILRLFFDEGINGVSAAIGLDDPLRKLDVLNLNRAVNAAALELAQSTLSTTNQEIETAVADLRSQLEQGLSQGEAADLLSDRVKGIFTSLATERAYLTEDTEPTRAKAAGELMAIQESGLKPRKKLLPDSMACEFCSALDGVSKELDEPFAVTGPGVYGTIQHPPYHPGCRCALQYDFDEDT